MHIYSNFNTPNNQTTYMGHSRNLQKGLDTFGIKQKYTPCDILEITKKIKDIVDTTFVKEKFIEEGSRNAVFKITRKYAARVPKNKKITRKNLGNDLKFGKRLYEHISNYYGEPIVELGSLQILRNIGRHLPAGVPEHIAKHLSKSKLNQYYVNRYLPKFAKVPQSAYDCLAQSISALNNTKIDGYKYCEFDSLNPNNIVLRGGKFYLVDEIETDCEKSFSNTTAKLLQVFINKADMKTPAPCDPRGIKNTRRIFKKVVLASSGADVPHAESKEDCKNWQIALKRCGIKDDVYTVINALENIDRKFPDLSARKENAKYFIDQLFVANSI